MVIGNRGQNAPKKGQQGFQKTGTHEPNVPTASSLYQREESNINSNDESQDKISSINDIYAFRQEQLKKAIEKSNPHRPSTTDSQSKKDCTKDEAPVSQHSSFGGGFSNDGDYANDEAPSSKKEFFSRRTQIEQDYAKDEASKSQSKSFDRGSPSEEDYAKDAALSKLKQSDNVRLALRDSYSYSEGDAMPSSWGMGDRRKIRDAFDQLNDYPKIQKEARAIVDSREYSDEEKSKRLGKLLSQ